MLKQTTYVLACYFALIVSASAAAQSPVSSVPDTASQEFAAIHTALSRAADFALNSAVLSTNPVRDNQDTQYISPDRPDSHSSNLNLLQARIQPILAREGVPDALAAVIQVESAGNPLALSPKGARGIWQLMPNTARRYGLIVDAGKDERIDVEKSTASAARYLRDLYTQFGSWPLALAAYNTGEKNVERAIARSHSNNFATLSFLGYLPAETRNYVPAVLAAMGNPSTTLTFLTVSAAHPSPTFALSGPND